MRVALDFERSRIGSELCLGRAARAEVQRLEFIQESLEHRLASLQNESMRASGNSPNSRASLLARYSERSFLQRSEERLGSLRDSLSKKAQLAEQRVRESLERYQLVQRKTARVKELNAHAERSFLQTLRQLDFQGGE